MKYLIPLMLLLALAGCRADSEGKEYDGRKSPETRQAVREAESTRALAETTEKRMIAASEPPLETNVSREILQIADFILGLQDEGGAIRDAPGRNVANEDSNMEYALIGMAAAYEHSRDPRYLRSLEQGIRWLAERESMDPPEWRGSWHYAYSTRPPYPPVAVSPGEGVLNARGVGATSSLFVYLLYLHKKVTQSDRLVLLYEANARAALEFVLGCNRSRDGFFFSSWQLRDGGWKLWVHRYASDQADHYLGLRAGSILYGESDYRYGCAADVLGRRLPVMFFDRLLGRYAEGKEIDGSLDEGEEFGMIFPQGYIPWVFGYSHENKKAYDWLALGLQPDGSLMLHDGDPRYSMTAALFGLAAQGLGLPPPRRSLAWLLSNTFDPIDGGVRDTLSPFSEKFSNVAGFAILALAQQGAW